MAQIKHFCRIKRYAAEEMQYWETILDLTRLDYESNFDMLGRPNIQMSQDIVAMQEIIWKVRPDLIIETDIAHGGSLIFSAFMLALLDICDAIEEGKKLDPKIARRKVLGIEIDKSIHHKLLITVAPDGYLKRVRQCH